MQVRVWAPNAETVELLIADGRVAMTAQDRGWWSVEEPRLKPGDDYAFSLDGGPARPDPRSMDQPHGVHGWSRVVDHGAYQWKHTKFRAPPLSSAVVYELHVGTFTPEGTLESALARLEHLRDLGVTHVELMPLNSFDGAHGWGYDGVCWFAPHRPYTGDAGPDAVKRFVDECHGAGLAVLIDVVYNHLGPSGNYLAEFGPYFSEAHSTPWGSAINLDGPGSDEVRRFICDNAAMWLREYRMDGLRIDAVHAFHDRSAVHLLEQIGEEVRAVEAETGRPLVAIAESDLNDPRVVRSVDAGGHGLDAQWSDDFHHALHAIMTGEREGYYADFGMVRDLKKALQNVFVYDGQYSGHRRRRHGRTPTNLAGTRFVGFLQNHDQIGNRAAGDRAASLMSDSAQKTAAAIVLLAPFVPLLFQGEEWGTQRPFQFFTDHSDPDLAEAIRAGRRREFTAFGWSPDDVPDPQDVQTFLRSKLDWEELRQPEHRDMLEWRRRLIQLRREHACLRNGRLADTRVTMNEDPAWLAMRRGEVLLVCNLWGSAQVIALRQTPAPEAISALEIEVLFATDECALHEESVKLSAWGSLIAALH